MPAKKTTKKIATGKGLKSNLQSEMMEALSLLDSYDVSEEKQRDIISDGVHFDFTYGDPDPSGRNKRLDIFGIVKLINASNVIGQKIDVTKMLEQPWNYKYEELVRLVSEQQKAEKAEKAKKSLKAAQAKQNKDNQK